MLREVSSCSPIRRPGNCSGPDPFRDVELDRLREQVRRLERVATSVVGLGTLAPGRPVLAAGTLALPTSYATGGVTFPIDVVPGLQDVKIAPVTAAGLLYVFEWDGADKIVVSDSPAFIEVLPGTNLDGTIGSVRYLAVGAAPAEAFLYTAGANELCHGADLYVAEDVAVDAAAYWDLRLVLRRAGEERRVLDLVSTSTRRIQATKGLRIADSERGVQLEPGDTLLLAAEETGEPAPLAGLAVWPDIRRRVA